MDIQKHWETIRQVVQQALESSHFCAVATVNQDGSPHVAPIGSLFLGEAGKAVYFEEFTKNTRQNLDWDQRICVVAVNSGFWFTLKSLIQERFPTPPGVRLMGRAGARRKATQEEVKEWQKRVRRFRKFKGYDLLWKDMRHVHEVIFDSFEPLRLGPMGRGLWED